MTSDQPMSVRERTRRLVIEELVALAQTMFVERGYEEVTVDEIAKAAGMSRRTFFRYFGSKEELLLGRYQVAVDRLVDAFAASPANEPLWESLRRALGAVAAYFDDPAQSVQTASNERIIQAYPLLRAGLYQRLAGLEDRWAEIIRDRTGRTGVDDPYPAMIAGSAVAALEAAKRAWLACGQSRTLASLIDDAMRSMSPTKDAPGNDTDA